MPALLFGSISTIADTSELQHGAFNDAFRQHGLDWHWEREEYQQLLEKSGGRQRIADFAASRGEDVDADAVHRTKSERFQEMLAGVGMTPRPGVVETIAAAREAGWKVGFVTTTEKKNVEALLRAIRHKVTEDDFDLITDVTTVGTPKPGGEIYRYALEQLGVNAAQVITIEDNLGGVQAAREAGVPVVAFPNENTISHDFGDVECIYSLSFPELAARVAADAR